MASDAIAYIDPKWQAGRQAIRAIETPGEETPQPSDENAGDEGKDQKIARGEFAEYPPNQSLISGGRKVYPFCSPYVPPSSLMAAATASPANR